MAAPGNPGIGQIAECVAIPPEDTDRLLAFAIEQEIGLTVVGPDDPLAVGIVDAFQARGLRIFGPTRLAAELESSKVFAKELMTRHGIPTARHRAFDSPALAADYISGLPAAPFVVKADGLARGKGVIVAMTKKEGLEAVDSIMVDRVFGRSGDRVVIEEYLDGEEASIFAVTDGVDFVTLVSSQDHKRIRDGDLGPNTGGMGAYSPAPVVSPEVMERVRAEIIAPTIHAMQQEGRRYRGVLYAGVMIGDDGPKVVEFNCRFGDPEAQVVLPLLKTDLLEVMLAVCDDSVGRLEIENHDSAAVCVVLASEGYPGDSPKGRPIFGLETAEAMDGVTVFHSGTGRGKDGRIVTSGGRVVGVTALGRGIRPAIDQAYRAAEAIRFEGMQYRRDVGVKALRRLAGA